MQHLPELFRMFYPLGQADQNHWASVLSLPDDRYVSALREFTYLAHCHRVSGPGSECEE